jgi:hypothetical protein
MEMPAHFPRQEKSLRQIEALLNRVRGLDRDAKARLSVMLDEEMDLPYLDVMEREYAKVFQRVAPGQATILRGRFVMALNEQRQFLIGLVRNALQTEEDNSMQSAQPKADPSAPDNGLFQ